MKRSRSSTWLFATIFAGAALAANAQDAAVAPSSAGSLRKCAVVAGGGGGALFAQADLDEIQATVDRQIFDALVADLRGNGYAVEPVFLDKNDPDGRTTLVDVFKRTRCTGLIQFTHKLGNDDGGAYFGFDVEVMHAAPTAQPAPGEGVQATLAGDFEKLYRFPRTEEGMKAFHMGVFANTAFTDLHATHTIEPYFDPDPDSPFVRNRYEQVVAANRQDEFHVRHILVADEATARSAIARIQAGEPFDAVARSLTIDDGSRDQGGDLGWAKPAAFVAEFSRAMKEMSPKGFDPQPVRTPFGWHVIEVLETRPARFPSFDDVKVKLAAQMKALHDQQERDAGR